MNSHGDLWPTITSDLNLKKAHKHAKQGKGWYEEVKIVDADIENGGKMLDDLQESLILHTYHTSPYTRKQRKEGNKIRDLYKLPYYPDRIAQWAVIQVIEPILIKNLITDTYSAIPKRGIHPGLERLKGWMDSDIVGTQYCLKIDARHYYQSINHELLKDKFRRLFKDADLIWFIEEVIDSINTANAEDLERLKHLLPPCMEILTRHIRGRSETPEQRKARYEQSGIGLPIGNYFSQYGGNFYFSEFDHYMKEVLHVQYYMRYMDDIVIFGESKEYLHDLRRQIDQYFQTHLRITLKDNWQVFPTYKRGVDYLGYRSFMGYTLLRKSTCKTFKRKMTRIRRKCESGAEMSYSEYCSINSYKGWLKSCNHYRLYKKYVEPLESYVAAYYVKHLQKKTDIEQRPITTELLYYMDDLERRKGDKA